MLPNQNGEQYQGQGRPDDDKNPNVYGFIGHAKFIGEATKTRTHTSNILSITGHLFIRALDILDWVLFQAVGYVAIKLGTAINANATKNRGHWKGWGRSVSQSGRPCSSAWSESEMKTYRASSPPRLIMPTRAEVKRSRYPRSNCIITRRMVRQIRAAMSIGDNTGPHQRSGIRNKISQSNRLTGQWINSLSQI